MKKIFRILNRLLMEGYYEFKYSDQMYLAGTNSGKGYNTSTNINKGFLGFEHEVFTAGIEGVQLSQKNVKFAPLFSATSAKKDTSDFIQTGLGFWIRGTLITVKLYALIMYDIFNPDLKRRGWEYYNKDFDSRGYRENFFLSRNADIVPRMTFFFKF